MPWTSVSSPCPSPHVLSPPSKHPNGKSQVQGTIYAITHAKMKKYAWKMKKCLEHSSWYEIKSQLARIWTNAQPLSPTPRKHHTTRPFCASAWLHRIWLQSVPGKMVESTSCCKPIYSSLFVYHLSWPSNVQKSVSVFFYLLFLSWLSLATVCTVCSRCLDYRQYTSKVFRISPCEAMSSMYPSHRFT